MQFGRIDLSKTTYQPYRNASILLEPNLDLLNEIYQKYCVYKKFKSVEPLFELEIITGEVVGYFEEGKLVAFSLISFLDDISIRGVQFAWDYSNPSLNLGWKANMHECAWYRDAGYKYYYLGSHHPYKSKLEGYEILGPLS